MFIATATFKRTVVYPLYHKHGTPDGVLQGVVGGLNWKNRIITGATKGIGRAIAEALVRAGVNVSICDVAKMICTKQFRSKPNR